MDTGVEKGAEEKIQVVPKERLTLLKPKRGVSEAKPEKPADSKKMLIDDEKVEASAASEELKHEKLQESLGDPLDIVSEKVKGDSSSDELMIEDPMEEEHGNSNEVLPDSKAMDLRKEMKKEDGEEGDNSEEIVDSGSIEIRKEEDTLAQRLEELKRKYGDLCQNSPAFQEMMLRLKDTSSCTTSLVLILHSQGSL